MVESVLESRPPVCFAAARGDRSIEGIDMRASACARRRSNAAPVALQALEPRTLLSGGATIAPLAVARPLRSAAQLHLNPRFPDAGTLNDYPQYPSLPSVNYWYFDLASPQYVTIVAYGSKDYD